MHKRIIVLALLIFSYAAYPQKGYKLTTGTQLDSIINTCLTSINSDSIHNDLQQLENFGTRFCLANNHRDVAVWLQNRFIGIGYNNTILDSFEITRTWNSQVYTTYEYNIVATLAGTETPDKIFIVGGHYDDIVNSGDPLIMAPGADDNGTAIAATLEIARIFKEKNYQPKSTIRFIPFAAEELGLYGSKDYALKAAANGDDIQMMINCDMIGTNSEDTSSWHINLLNYTGSENVTSLAWYITQNYTSLHPVDVNSNSAGSDSHSFWINGFPTIFLQEYEFSSVYHTVNDLVVNIDPVYCAEITKVACGMLLQANESPDEIIGLSIYDVGNGTSLKASWQPALEYDLDNYKIYVGTASQVYDTSYTSTDTSITITDLIEGVYYYIGVSATDIDGNEGMITEAVGTPLSAPRIPEGLEQLVSSSFIKLGWKRNKELDLLGYGIFRSDSPNGTYAPVVIDAVEDTSYTDNTVSDHTMYYYKISAMDSTFNQSASSDAIKGRTISHDMGVLIVDDSEGGWLNPTDQQVDDFYNNLMAYFTHNNYDAVDSTKISIADMGAYSTLLWHINRKLNNPVFRKNSGEIKKYLESGGNLLFTVHEPQSAVQGINGYPYTYAPGDFMYDYLKIDNSEMTDEGLFIGATPFAAGYDSLYIDTTKTSPDNNHHVLGIEAVNPGAGAQSILRYDTYYSIADPAGNMKNKSVGVEYLGTDYKAITISFPLYFMNFDEAKTFTDFVMQQKFGEIMGTEEYRNSGITSFSIYPNPVNDLVTLNIFSDRNTDALFEIYSVTGQLFGKYSFDCYQGLLQKAIDVSSLPAGFYFCTLMAGDLRHSAKMIIAR